MTRLAFFFTGPKHNQPYRALKFIIVVFLLLSQVFIAAALPLSTYPANAPVLNIQNLGADPKGRSDSSEVIISAIKQVEEGQFRVKYVYLPAGTYRITRPIVGGRFVTLIGAGLETTTLQLDDNSSAFSDSNKPTPMVQLGRTANESFGVFIQGITIDTGQNNPGAVGLDYQAHNVGAIRDLRIRSGDGAGVAGLKLKRSENNIELTPGPHLVKNVEVIGFERGIWMGENRSGICHVTFDQIRLSDQKKAGFHFDTRLHASIRKLRSRNNCPAVLFAKSYGASASIIESRLESAGETGAAIEVGNNNNRIHLAEVVRNGYAAMVSGPMDILEAGNKIKSWNSHSPVIRGSAAAKFPDPEETPALPKFSLDQWQHVAPGKLQESLNSGKPVIYFPQIHEVRTQIALFGGITNTLTIPSSVEHLAFFGQAITSANWNGEANPVFRIEGTKDDPPLFISRNDYHNQDLFKGPMFEHAGARTVVFLSSRGSYVARPGSGNVYFEDHVGGYFRFQPGQKVFGRQLNPEDARHGNMPLIDNRGAELWVLGLKTEGAKTIIRQSGPSRTRIVGGLFLPLVTGSTKDLPLLEILEGSFEISGYNAWYTWPIHVRMGTGANSELLTAEGKRMESLLQINLPSSP